MSKIVRLTESDLIRLVKRVIKEQEGFDELDDFEDISDESSDFPDEEDNVEDLGFDVEDDFSDDDEFQNKMRFRERVRRNLPGSVGVGSGTRWDKDSEKEYSPIKADDLPLDKFLKSKYNKK